MIWRRVWLALLFALALTGPAWAEMTPDDVRGQITSLLAERRFENDRRLESLEKQQELALEAIKTLIAEKEKLRESDMRTVRTNIEDNVKFFSSAVDNLRTADANHVQQLKETQTSASLAQNEQIKAAFAAAKEAVDKAAVATEKRFDSVNEFRAQLKDQQAMLMPRGEAESKIKANTESLTALTQRLDQLSGRTQGADAMWLTFTGAAGLVIGAVGVALTFMRRDIGRAA